MVIFLCCRRSFYFSYSASLIKNNYEKINRMLLDTTWICLPYYVTGILIASIYMLFFWAFLLGKKKKNQYIIATLIYLRSFWI